MWSVTSDFLASLRIGHQVTTEADLYLAGVKQNTTPLPILSGSVTVDASSKVRRAVNLTVDHTALTTEQADAIYNPFGQELHIRSGVRYPNGDSELVPVGVFRYDTDDDDVTKAGGLHIAGPDRARAVQDFRLLEPTASNTAITIALHIQQFLQDTFPGMILQDSTADTTLVKSVVWDQDRWDACIDMATSIGAEVFFRADGLPWLRSLPALTDSPVWLVDVGTTGVMVAGDRSKSRETTYSGVVVRGERTDGTNPAYGVAWDTDVASPTYHLGAFGKVPRFYSSPFITDDATAEQVALSLLPKYTSFQRQLSLTAVPNPALEAGDVIDVLFPDGRLERHMIERMTIPLTYQGAMTIDTRSSNPESA